MSEPKRLFFALELPSAVQKQIVQWRATHFPEDAGRPVAADNLHLTLAFLGEVSAEKQRALAALAGRLRQPGFTLTLGNPKTIIFYMALLPSVLNLQQVHLAEWSMLALLTVLVCSPCCRPMRCWRRRRAG